MLKKKELFKRYDILQTEAQTNPHMKAALTILNDKGEQVFPDDHRKQYLNINTMLM